MRCAVIALAGNAGDNIDGRIALSVQRQSIFGLGHDLAHAKEDKILFGRLGILFQLLQKGFVRFLPRLFVAGVPFRPGQGEARFPQTLLDRDAVAGVYLAGAGAAANRTAHTAAVSGQCAGLFQREAAVLFQQHSTPGQPLA